MMLFPSDSLWTNATVTAQGYRAVAELASSHDRADSVFLHVRKGSQRIHIGPLALEDHYGIEKLRLCAPEKSNAVYLLIYGHVFVDTDSIDIFRIDLTRRKLTKVYGGTTRGDVWVVLRGRSYAVEERWSVKDPWARDLMPKASKKKYVRQTIFFDPKSSTYVESGWKPADR